MDGKVSGPLVALLAYGCFLWLGLALAETPPGPVASISRGPDSAPDLQSEAMDAAAMEPATSRQYFKIHITPGHQRRHLRPSSSSLKRRAAGNHQQPEVGPQQQQPKPKISNAALKKLLNQSLMLRAGGSDGQSSINSLNSPSKSNFKFVFIQRATPSSTSTSTTSASSPTETSTSLGKTTKRPEAAKGTNHESLAASVSKQLASSLLSSAVQLVGNLTSSSSSSSSSSAPSLSALATQLASKKETKGANSITTSNGPPAEASTASEAAQSTGNKKDSHAPLSTSINTKTRQPSKIYNLPVKFVGNGQLHGVQVFSQLKKHFATIKKLQQLNDNNSLGRLHSPGDFRPSATGGASGSGQKQLKVKQQQALHKLRGQSRLIYLPLKYLSNAKPAKVTVASAQHQKHRSAANASRR